MIPSFNSSWNNSLFIFHLRCYHVWASASLGPSSRAGCFSLEARAKQNRSNSHLLGARQRGSRRLCICITRRALLSLCGFKYPHILCSPPTLLSRIITLHASKCERGGSVGFYYDSLNTRTRTPVVRPLSRLLF